VFEFHTYEQQDFTLLTAEGAVPLEQWRDTLLEYDRVGATKYELYDLRRFENAFSVNDMFFLADLGAMTRSERPAGSKTALLVSQREGQGLSKVYDILAQARAATWETKAFFSLDEAEKWLGIDLGDVREQLDGEEAGAE
jgi:hypothetical protein